MISILTTLSINISTIVLAITGVFGGAGEDPAAFGSSSPKDRILKKWLNKLGEALKRLARKAFEERLAC